MPDSGDPRPLLREQGAIQAAITDKRSARAAAEAELYPLDRALGSAGAKSAAEKSLDAASKALTTARAAKDKAQAVADTMAAALESERAALQLATQKAAVAMIRAAQEGKPSTPKAPDSGPAAVAEYALAEARAAADTAAAAVSAAEAAHKDAGQQLRESDAECTLLALMLVESQYRAALAAHLLAYWHAYKTEYRHSNIPALAKDDMRAVLLADD